MSISGEPASVSATVADHTLLGIWQPYGVFLIICIHPICAESTGDSCRQDAKLLPGFPKLVAKVDDFLQPVQANAEASLGDHIYSSDEDDLE